MSFHSPNFLKEQDKNHDSNNLNQNDVWVLDLDHDELNNSNSTFNKSQLVENNQEDNDSQTPLSRRSPTSKCMETTKGKSLYYVLWTIVNIFCVVCSYIFIENAFNTWQSSPVVQALSNSQIHFENVPFPAVTICWPNSFHIEYNFTHYISRCLDCKNDDCNNTNEECTNEDLAMLALAHQMCPKKRLHSPSSRQISDRIPKVIDASEFNVYMEKLQPHCGFDMLTLQIAQDFDNRKNYTRCNEEIFQQFYSNNYNSLCTTFNGLKHEDLYRENVITPLKRFGHKNKSDSNFNWSFDTMMKFEGTQETVPIYGLTGILALIQPQTRNHEKDCKHFDKDLASVLVHNPNEIPYDYIVDYTVRQNIYTIFTVEPKITLARENLAQYPPHQRGCFFSHEGNLALFKFYTKRNCEFECLSNAYLNACGCVPFSFPRLNDSTKICLQQCLRPKFRCECLPDCNSLTYGVSVQEVVTQVGDDSFASFELFISGNSFYTTVRYSISSYAEFLAYSLGILGAFLGLSVTCLWQIFYFGAVRVWKTATSCHKDISPVA